MNNDLISREALKEIRFKSNKFIQIGGRTNGKTLKNVSIAYQMGWNDAIDAIIDNAPTVELFCSYLSDEEVRQPCVEVPCNHKRPHGEWIKEDKPWGGFGDSVLVLTCSECGESFIYHGNKPKFCSECGADMRGDAE